MNDPKDFSRPIALLRDVEAVLIPEGTPVTLRTDTDVYVTQALGGSVTVNVNGNLARISPENVDALGMESEASPAGKAAGNDDGSIDISLVWEQLSTCYDPEIPIDIVELGLIYRCEIEPGPAGNRVVIDMTLTAPGCGMGEVLVQDVKDNVEAVPTIREARVELVFDPPWDHSMMSEAARLATGMM